MPNTKNLIELKQERANLTTSIRALMDEFSDAVLPAEKETELAKMEADFDSLNGKIIREEAQLERERAAGEVGSDDVKDAKDTKDDVMDSFKNYLSSGKPEVYNALQQGNPSQAGYLVAPEKFVMELIKDLDNSLFMRQKAKVLPALRGAKSLGYPRRVARMNSAAWGSEIAAPTPDTTLEFGKREFIPHPATSEILISKTLIRNAPEVDAIVRAEIAYENSELLEIAYMTGDGANKPLGIFTASNDGISTARDVSTGNTATDIKVDGLLEAKYSIKNQYQANCEWIFHRDAVKRLMKLKNSDGQYIWQQSIVANQPDMLLGKPINMSEYAPNTFTTGLYVGIYGDLKYYWICDSLAFEIQVLTELYARTNQIDYISRLETDGMPVLEEAFARVTLG